MEGGYAAAKYGKLSGLLQFRVGRGSHSVSCLGSGSRLDDKARFSSSQRSEAGLEDRAKKHGGKRRRPVEEIEEQRR